MTKKEIATQSMYVAGVVVLLLMWATAMSIIELWEKLIFKWRY